MKKSTLNKKQNLETIDRKGLMKTAQKASLKAKRISVALDLPVNVISGGFLTQQLPNGQVFEIKKVEKVKTTKTGLKKGSVLCLK